MYFFNFFSEYFFYATYPCLVANTTSFICVEESVFHEILILLSKPRTALDLDLLGSSSNRVGRHLTVGPLQIMQFLLRDHHRIQSNVQASLYLLVILT